MTTEQMTDEEKLPPVESIGDYDDESESSAEDREKEDSRFKEGQILRFVRVRFPGNSRSFSFLIGKRLIEYGQKVVAMSDRGMAVGYVNSFPYDVPFNKSMLPIRSISKVAGEDDIKEDRDAYHQQKRAENTCNDLIEAFKLDMHLTHVEFTSFGKKAVFYFIAPARVDFRDLVKDLVGKLKMRIELRQISVRDRSASIGGIGPCGRELCCSSFLTKYGNVGIKMAKNQDLTLNFSKLNGVCGQLKCCLQYEDDVYREKRARLPKEGDFVTTHTGEAGRVDRLHLLTEQFVMMTNRGVRRRYTANLYKDTVTKEEANFPNEFDSVSDETHKVIGLEESLAKKAAAFEEEVKAYKEPSKKWAENIFENLFGEKSLGLEMPELEEPVTDKPRAVKTIDDEEEIQYTMSEDEILPDDDDSLNNRAYDMDLRSNNNNRSKQDNNQGNRQHNHQGRDRGPRPQGQGTGNQNNNNNNQNRGPRPPGQQNANPNQNQNRGPRPQGQPGQQNNNNQNRGPRPQNNNQGGNTNGNQQNRGPRQGR